MRSLLEAFCTHSCTLACTRIYAYLTRASWFARASFSSLCKCTRSSSRVYEGARYVIPGISTLSSHAKVPAAVRDKTSYIGTLSSSGQNRSSCHRAGVSTKMWRLANGIVKDRLNPEFRNEVPALVRARERAHTRDWRLYADVLLI